MAPQHNYWGTRLSSHSSWLSGWASWCSAVTFVHMMSCQEQQQPFSEARPIFRKRNYSDRRAAIRAYPTTQTNAAHVGCFSRMQISDGFREAIHFRHHLVSWPISNATVCECVCLPREWIIWLTQLWRVTHLTLCNQKQAEGWTPFLSFAQIKKKKTGSNCSYWKWFVIFHIIRLITFSCTI